MDGLELNSTSASASGDPDDGAWDQAAIGSHAAWTQALTEASTSTYSVSRPNGESAGNLPFQSPKPDPWGVAGAAIGGVIGAIIGGGTGGLGGGAGGTLVAPGVGTVGGAIAGGAEGAAVGGAAGAAAGYGVGSALHSLQHWMASSSSSSGGAEGPNEAQKPDPGASKPYRDDPGQLEGKSPSDVEKDLDKTLVQDGHWTKSPTRDGNGVRYLDGKGGSVIINKGYPEGLQGGGGDAVHQGPYVKIQPGGIRVPLAGNPAVGN